MEAVHPRCNDNISGAAEKSIVTHFIFKNHVEAPIGMHWDDIKIIIIHIKKRDTGLVGNDISVQSFYRLAEPDFHHCTLPSPAASTIPC